MTPFFIRKYPIKIIIAGTSMITGSIPPISGLVNSGLSSANATNSEVVALTCTTLLTSDGE